MFYLIVAILIAIIGVIAAGISYHLSEDMPDPIDVVGFILVLAIVWPIPVALACVYLPLAALFYFGKLLGMLFSRR